MRTVVLFLVFLPAGLVPLHTVDTGGLCGVETLGQTSVSHRVKPHHQFADMLMFERERNTFHFESGSVKMELLYRTD